MKRFIERL